MSLLSEDLSIDYIPSSDCFSTLFAQCEILTKPPLLPATELKAFCYSNMFLYCFNLESAPLLPAPKLEDNCYSLMFTDDNKINSIEVGFTDWIDGTER